MNVSDLIDLMANLSIGLDNPSDSDISIFLKYLNLAYYELLQDSHAQNPDVPIIREELTCTDGVLDSTQYKPFIIKKVWDAVSNTPLIPTNEKKISDKDPGLKTIGQPQEWYYASGQVNIYPLYTGQIGISYLKIPDSLKITTSSDQILIPKIFQQILADGAAYYVFQQETGFKDAMKQAESKIRWKDGKIKLFNYFKNLGGQYAYSTYSPV
jgi:hypothetical protein